MENLDELKKSRANTKRKVTVLSKKLKNSIQYGNENAKAILNSLDEEYYRLFDIQLQIEELSEEDDGYMELVDRDYNEVRKLYSVSEMESEEIENKKRLERLGQVREDDSVNGTLSTETLSQSVAVTEVHTSNAAGGVSESSVLDNVISSHNLPAFLQDALTITNSPMSVPSQTSISGPLLSSSPLSHRARPFYANSFVSGGGFPPGPSLSVGSSIYAHSHLGMSQGPPLSYGSRASTQTVHYEPLNASVSGGGFTPGPSMSVASSIYAHSRLGMSQGPPLSYGSQLSTQTGHYQPLITSVSSGGFPPGPSMSFASTHLPKVSFPQQINYNPQMSTSVMPPNSVMGDTPPSNTFPTYPSQPGSGQSQREVIHTKKPSLPFFSGERVDWPEFKCTWRALAEAQYKNHMQLAMELKRCCKGRAGERLKHIYVTNDSAYNEMWKRLSEEYDDPGLSIQSALSRLTALKLVEERDHEGIVRFADIIDGVHSQLKELQQLDAVHVVDVDKLALLLPREIHRNWLRKYMELAGPEKLKPFSEFVEFMRRERSVVARLAEWTTRSYRHVKDKKPVMNRAGSHGVTGQHNSKGREKEKVGPEACTIHGGSGHSTADCRNFKKMTVKQKYEELRKKHRCFNCLGEHPRSQCLAPSCKCGKAHHQLLCTSTPSSKENTTEGQEVTTGTGIVNQGCAALYPIQEVFIAESSQSVTVFMDAGSDASYITEACANRLHLKRGSKVSLNVTVVGGGHEEYKTNVYEVPLRTKVGRIEKIQAYGLKRITGPLTQLNSELLGKLFPKFDVDILLRPSKQVDILLGTDYFGLHPKKEVDRAGPHLSIMEGALGACLVGNHPELKEEVELYAPKLDAAHSRQTSGFHISSHPAFDKPNFFDGEELATDINIKCGGCKCGSCPIPGHSLSFKEEQELDMIRAGLEYDQRDKLWRTSYPWLVDPSNLPDNYGTALKTLMSTERSLKKDPSWALSYQEQMDDMLNRNVARKLSPEESRDWNGPKFYISHLAVKSSSKSTPVRIVFNSSQISKGTSLNNCLAKGPDSYRNTTVGILLRWREEHVAIVGDIKKMFHSILLKPVEQHCHRFLWRNLEDNRDPDEYIMERVNMGDRPSPAIATEALYKTAELHEHKYPRAAKFVKGSSYVDDLIDSVGTNKQAEELAKETENLLAEGNFKIKGWQMSSTTRSDGGQNLKGDDEHVGVLGMWWNPDKDSISYKVTLNFSDKRRGERTGPNLMARDVPESIPETLSKRLVLQQVMSLYDPLRLVGPYFVLAMILLRKTWLLKLEWDDPLPSSHREDWIKFFKDLFLLENMDIPRCLRPRGVDGKPWLIILSDGSELAYGCAAYIRWASEGRVYMSLIMSKCRIAPINTVSIPRMELNGAVLSKRCRVAISKEMRYPFERVIHLVDSETVLNMINNLSCRFKVYEGVRVGEIQAATGGDMSDWYWICGEDNIADWVTRGRTLEDMKHDSEWFTGPSILKRPFSEWNVKTGRTHNEALPGEKKLTGTCVSNTIEQKDDLYDCSRVSSLQKAIRIVARILGIFQQKSFNGGCLTNLNPTLMMEAEKIFIKDAQISVEMESPDYKRLNPARRDDGIWVVGSTRLANKNPMSHIYAGLPIFLPSCHRFTRLAMLAAHNRAHRGRDATLASFRERFWTPGGPKLAKSVVSKCQLCRLRNTALMRQQMGRLPVERLTPAPPFNFSMLDLFGPYQVRGEVQKRISGKVWGVLFTDMVARAVHIEVMYGYDTDSFMLALRRFVSIRGWPEKLYSDPGSQLAGAKREMKDAICKSGHENGLDWTLGTPDAPWEQGAVESLVKTVKRALDISIHNQRLSVPEFQTVCSEVANLVNERPLGLLPDLDSDINVLTPNCLLLGRASSSNPNNWLPNHSLKTRGNLVSSIENQFWIHWMELFAPSLVYRHKWHEKERDIQVDDVVLILDSDTFRGQYRLGIVQKTHPGRDGIIRVVTVGYKNFRVDEKVYQYKGQPYKTVKRRVQRLVLLVPVEEQ